MKQKRYQWGIGILKWVLPFAQDDTKMREVYAQAENAYRIGRIEQAREMLLQNLSTLQGNSRQSALRLIALTYMDDYDIPKAEQYVTLLLEQNPYYTPSSNDPATFVEIVNHIKAGMTPTITTASNRGACAHDADHRRDDPDQRGSQSAGGAGSLRAGHEPHRL